MFSRRRILELLSNGMCHLSMEVTCGRFGWPIFIVTVPWRWVQFVPKCRYLFMGLLTVTFCKKVIFWDTYCRFFFIYRPYSNNDEVHEPTDRNHLGQCTALSNKTECERYWEARTKMMGNWLCYFIITTFFVTTPKH